MRMVMLTAVLVCAIAALADERGALLGTWTGSSKCTDVRPACHDEEALYRITPVAGKDATVNMSMAKVVDGKEVVMGVLPFRVDYEHGVLSSEFTRGDIHGLWTFHWTGSRMTGTLTMPPDGPVIRNIVLRKQ